MESKTWKTVIKGHTPPTNRADDVSVFVKPKEDWTFVKDEEADANSCALKLFTMTCTSAKESWETL